MKVTRDAAVILVLRADEPMRFESEVIPEIARGGGVSSGVRHARWLEKGRYVPALALVTPNCASYTIRMSGSRSSHPRTTS